MKSVMDFNLVNSLFQNTLNDSFFVSGQECLWVGNFKDPRVWQQRQNKTKQKKLIEWVTRIPVLYLAQA